MYKIKGISDMQLKSLVGKRVEVVGLMSEEMKVSSSAAAPPQTRRSTRTRRPRGANASHGEEKGPVVQFRGIVHPRGIRLVSTAVVKR